MSRAVSGAWALTPVKRLDCAKSRLSPTLDAVARRRLQEAMLTDVLRAARRARRLAGVAVVTADPAAVALALGCGARVIWEPESEGLDRAVSRGAAALAADGAEVVAAIPADAPLVDEADIDRAVALSVAAAATVVAADRHGEGTNALVFPAVAPPLFAYGPGSFDRHVSRPGALALSLASVRLDIDLPVDIEAFDRSAGGPATRAALAAMRVRPETSR